jgi:hypothetical protein
MSSETSTEAPRLRSGPAAPVSSEQAQRDQFQPWQLFTLAGLAAATAVVALVVFVWDGDRITAILLSVVVASAALAGLAAYRAFAPLAGSEDTGIGAEMLAGRTRAALEREKTLALRTIKELEFDHSMGKLSEKDFTEMSARLRARAARIMRQLDQGAASYKGSDREGARQANASRPGRRDERVRRMRRRKRSRCGVLQEVRREARGVNHVKAQIPNSKSRI